MTAIEALRILENVWGGSGTIIGLHDAGSLEGVALPKETLLQTAARIAGVDVSQVESFDRLTISRLCFARRSELARKKSP